MAYFVLSLETGQKFFYEPYFQEHWFLSTPSMFSDYKVLQKYSYNPALPIWMDKARRGLQDGTLCFVFCDRLCLLPRHTGSFTYSESM